MNRFAYRLSPLAALALAACTSSNPMERHIGQTAYVSSPPLGGSGGLLANDRGGGAPQAKNTPAAPQNGQRTVEETDLYRLEGTRLYYLNSYRGLMVFDVSQVDAPKLLGRSAIYGDPVDMIVRDGIAVVIVGDWYGLTEDGTPFHGSVVRGLDATDPTNIKVLGEAQLDGWVQDSRVVGDVLYTVSQDWGWVYDWNGYGGTTQNSVIVSSVNFANNQIALVGSEKYEGYSGIFNVTPNSILLAHAVEPGQNQAPPLQTELLYLDISDPKGAIVERGSIVVNGQADGWGPDNGRWNLDFADGKTAHVVGCTGPNGWCDGSSGYILSTVDFTKPDAPVQLSELTIPTPGWAVAARFDTGRLYLSPTSTWGDGTSTPFQTYDLTDPVHPALAGTITVSGAVWNILPAPNHRIFALGNDWQNQTQGEQVSLKYLDVTDPKAPALLGTSNFGQGWAWTPAAGTFKAFTMDSQQGLVVLPFSGWDEQSYEYQNGLQLIQFDDLSTHTAGAAHTKGWVERGIFVQNRLVSLSDLALAVVDYSDPESPTVTASLTLARNVVAARPGNGTIAEVSSDWWGNDLSTSEVRILPIANADESSDSQSALDLNLEGVGARVFNNGSLSYVVTNVQTPVPCPNNQGVCYGRAEKISVVDLSNGNAQLRGTVTLPIDNWGWYGWGWWGFWWYDWWGGAEVVQVGSDALAFRRWEPVFGPNGNYLDSNSLLYVVDLANADAPQLASVTITNDPDGWWGNMRVVGQTLYTSHYEWTQKPNGNDPGTVQYYVDQIDLSDRAQPVIGAKVNVPGLLVGGFDGDPSLLVFVDYRWGQNDNQIVNDFDVCRIGNGVCELQSKTALDGWAGQTFVRSNTAYVSTQIYDWNVQGNQPSVELHAIDLTDPMNPVDRIASGQKGWGWLLAVEGDRAVVSSGWGWGGVDIYQIGDGQAPVYKQFVRALGWWTDGVTRQDDALYLSSGYWGVQKIDLK